MLPLEQLVRQYLGFDESVVKEYNTIIEYDDFENCLRDKRSPMRWTIAQWRSGTVGYIYQFRYVFNNNERNNRKYFWLEERVSEPRRYYGEIVKLGFPVGRVI